MQIVLVFSFLCLTMSGDFCAAEFDLFMRKGIEHPDAELMYSRVIDGDRDYDVEFSVPGDGEMRFYNVTKYEISSSEYFKNRVRGVTGGQGKNFVKFFLWILPETKMIIKVWGTYLTSSPCKK